MSRYFDPTGLFSVDLPTEHAVTVIPGEAPSDTGALQVVGGVQAAPRPPDNAGGFGALGAQTARDQTVYSVWVIRSPAIETTDDLVSVITTLPGADLRVQQPASIGGMAGELVVTDLETETGVHTAAWGFVIEGGTGYILEAAFAGDWEGERGDFTRILDSFRPDVPAGLDAVPIGVA